MKRNKKLLWLGLPILLLLVVWFKWDNWFYNPPEPPYTPSATPDRILLTWSGDPLNSRDVTWQGDTLTQKGFLQVTSNSIPGDTILYTLSLIHISEPTRR